MLRLPQVPRSHDRVVAGVAAGWAERWGVEPTVVRAALGLLTLVGGLGAVLYGVAALASTTPTELTAQALRYFALGLPFVSASRIIASAFYAQQDAKKPVLAANATVLVNIIAGILLLTPMQHRGLALAVSLGSITNFLILMILYHRQAGALGLNSIMISAFKILLASGFMGAALLGMLSYRYLSFAPFTQRGLYLGALIAGGALLYALLVVALKVEGAGPLLARLKKRLK